MMPTFQLLLRQVLPIHPYLSSQSMPYLPWRSFEFSLSGLESATRKRVVGVQRQFKARTKIELAQNIPREMFKQDREPCEL